MAIPLCAIATGEGNVGKKQESESRRPVFMITGEIKSKVDRIWDTMWSGGISNPLSVIEQLTETDLQGLEQALADICADDGKTLLACWHAAAHHHCPGLCATLWVWTETPLFHRSPGS
jgi:hypothetical protein